MFKIPDFDEDVPKTDLNYNKTLTKPNEKVTNKVGSKHKPMVKKKKIKTANNSIVKAKDKVTNTEKYKAQKNAQVANKNKSHVQGTEGNKCKESKPKLNAIQAVTSIPRNSLETNKSVPNINNKNKKPKNLHESDMHWLENDGLGTIKKNKKKQKHKVKDFDEELLEAGKKMLNDSLKRDDQDNQLLFTSNKPLTKKEKLRKMLSGHSDHRSPLKANSNLREKMLEKLRSAQFRYLNEKLYTSTGREAQELFQEDPAAFRTYHAGFRQQVRKWPVNPLHVIAKRIKSFPKSYVVADMGCGEGELSTLVPQRVHSFDLVAASARVTACDMARTPLPAAAADAAVYCLALMGTQLTDYLLEANRILRVGGRLLIAEVESRFESVQQFSAGVARLGFRAARAARSQRLFRFLEFEKVRDAPKAARAGLPQLTLRPCLYKKR